MNLADENATVALAQRLAARLKPGMVIYLHGDLGAGKTTLVRGVLNSLGYTGAVKSPTYTLVEPYRIAGLDLRTSICIGCTMKKNGIQPAFAMSLTGTTYFSSNGRNMHKG